MNINIIDMRRFLRNRLDNEVFNISRNYEPIHDECKLPLKEVCEALLSDKEELPRYLDPTMRKFCGHEHRIWFQKDRTYADAARLLLRKIAGKERRLPPVGPLWVCHTLKEEALS